MKHGFKDLIVEIDTLIAQMVTAGSPEFRAWKSKVNRRLISEYGENSYEYKEFSNLHFSPMFFGFGEDGYAEDISACGNGLARAKAILQTYDEESNCDETGERMKNAADTKGRDAYKRVFVVHGHDDALKVSIARVLEKQGIEAIILHEQENRGATIIEKIEKHSDVDAAICLFTKDDTVLVGDERKLRARQNVIFEAGYFTGLLGRERVVIVADDGVELPSDLHGVVYINKGNWEVSVLKELKSIGYSVDLNKL